MGQVLIAFVSGYFFYWKDIQLIMLAIPLIVLFINSLKLIESPRWLVMKREYQQAKTNIIAISLVNGRKLDDFLIQEESKNRELDTHIQGMLHNYHKKLLKHEVKHSYYSLFNFNSIRIRTIGIIYIFLMISFSRHLTYEMSFSQQKEESFQLRFQLMLMGFIEIIGYLLTAYISLNEERKQILRCEIIYIYLEIFGY